MVYSCPMRDLLVLTQEYCQGNNGVARFMLNNLEDHQCLVLETLLKKQQLFTWKADLLELRNQSVVRQSTQPPDPSSRKTMRGSDCASEDPPAPRQTGTCVLTGGSGLTGRERERSPSG